MDRLGYLLFVLLFSSCKVADGQTANSSDCSKPSLNNGYYVTESNTHKHNSDIKYACEKGFKKRGEGWWGTSKCVDGHWLPDPECIDKNDCFAPDDTNAVKVRKLESGHFLIECKPGYEINSTPSAQLICDNGKLSTGSCTKNATSCGPPPFVSYAVIYVIASKYQDIFANKDVVEYKCKESYTSEGSMSSTCKEGTWSQPPKCQKPVQPVQPVSPVQPVQPVPGDGKDEAGGSTQNRRQPLRLCGPIPDFSNGLISQLDEFTLVYKCRVQYAIKGPEHVICLENGMWSERPYCLESCKLAWTEMPPEMKKEVNAFPGIIYVPEGESKRVFCYKSKILRNDYYFNVRCSQGRLHYNTCVSV